MPALDDPIHHNMYQSSPVRRPRVVRALRAAARELRTSQLYGLEWGDPDSVPPLQWVRDHWCTPYVDPTHTAVEIGPGGGRWTQYLVGFGRLYAVDYHQELLTELRKHFTRPNVEFVHNHGSDFPGVPPVDFVFSFGTFVHLDPEVIDGYLSNLLGVLKPTGQVVLQYADQTKPIAQASPGFSDMTPERMRAMVSAAGFTILEEDTATLWHSALIRFGPRAEG